MAAVDLEVSEWQFLSVLLAQDIRGDEAKGLPRIAAHHRVIWEKLQAACQWDSDEG